MFTDFDKIFHRTPEQKKQQINHVRTIVVEGIRNNSCSMCEHGVIEEIPKWGPELEDCTVKMFESRSPNHCDKFEISKNCIRFLTEADEILGQE